MPKVFFHIPASTWTKDLAKQIMKANLKNLTEYAKNEINRIGSSFLSWNTTGNLLDSICWGLYLDGKMYRSGYYREPAAMKNSYLHALSGKQRRVEVNGRMLAERFISTYSPETKHGIELVFGVLAPYWAYWEREGGHYNRLLGQQVQFRVLSQHYDEMKAALSPPIKFEFIVNSPV